MAKFDILKAADEFRAQADKLKWAGTFADYLELVREIPESPTSHTLACTIW